MKSPKYIPQIKPVVFWDIPIDELHYTNDCYFIICRVFNYGNFQEVADIIVCYGKEYVKEILLSTTDLNIIGLSTASAFLGIPEKEFKCYGPNIFPLNC